MRHHYSFVKPSSGSVIIWELRRESGDFDEEEVEVDGWPEKPYDFNSLPLSLLLF